MRQVAGRNKTVRTQHPWGEKVLILIVWVMPGDTGGGGDKYQDLSNDGEFPRFKGTFSAT